MNSLKQAFRDFNDERDWHQFHTPGNLAKSVSIEAAELLECFQWSETNFDRDHVLEELADVFSYCIMLADELDADINEIVLSKIKKNAEKYPVELARGMSKKYSELK